MNEFIIGNISAYLIELGFSEINSKRSAQDAFYYYSKKVSNSKDAYKDTCDFAGAKAMISEPKIKYKSQKSKANRRNKKPQEAFNFGGECSR